ncbi:MAG TPA: c-type cytochrome [Actinomycetota bacterium]|nr:c-type cytochrome [Actinomycetota bacterium]
MDPTRGRGWMRLRLALIGTVAAMIVGITGALVAAQSPTPTPTAPSPSPSLSTQAQAGRILYLRDCAWCHGQDGSGGQFGPSLVGVGAESADFMLSTGRMPIPTVEEQPPRKKPVYTQAQINDLVAYVASLGTGPDIPPVNPAAGDLGQGAQLYEENCAACHSSTGVGGALTSGLQAPTILDSTARQIAEAIRLGGAGLRTGKMPKFETDALSNAQVDSIVRYVLYLQHPEDRGGASLARIGPVAEGFVAWFVGLLVLILFIAWIGERTA